MQVHVGHSDGLIIQLQATDAKSKANNQSPVALYGTGQPRSMRDRMDRHLSYLDPIKNGPIPKDFHGTMCWYITESQ